MADRIYGLLGARLGHSWSVPIHAALGNDAYRLYELEPAELAAFLRREDIGGVNVTIPYKRDVMPLCDGLHPTAKAIGSVNTIVRQPDGALVGYNTDIDGFLYMAHRAGISLNGKKVVILGTGGASLTAQAAARQAHAREIAVISRSGPDDYDHLDRHADAEVVVNTTPVGMFPHTGAAPVNLTRFPRCQGVLDVIYNPRRTALVLQAEALGIPCSDGLPMLVAQAKRAEEHFFRRAIPDRENERILAQLRQETCNIVLIGMPGCGKTTVGQALAALSGREALDLDQQIVEKAGKSIPQIFAEQGEAAFRALEREVVAEAGKLTGKLLLTGGGVVTVPENYGPLRQNGRIYHLVRDLDALPTEGRPLSQSTDLRALWETRAPLYARFRDVVIQNSGTVQETAQEIWRDFCAHSGT
nr:shikimate kinase [uncultured Dysosmobacter sp.]